MHRSARPDGRDLCIGGPTEHVAGQIDVGKVHKHDLRLMSRMNVIACRATAASELCLTLDQSSVPGFGERGKLGLARHHCGRKAGPPGNLKQGGDRGILLRRELVAVPGHVMPFGSHSRQHAGVRRKCDGHLRRPRPERKASALQQPMQARRIGPKRQIRAQTNRR